MSKLNELGELIEVDVLIIGGGFAGIWAAIRAKDFVEKVLVVDKAKVARSGCSTFSAGVQLCPTPEDDLNVWKQEIVESGDYFPDQDWVDVFLRNQIERIRDYEKWGALLERDEKGRVARIVGRANKNTRLFQFHGPKLMELLRNQALKKGVKLLERVMITDLLTSDGLFPNADQAVGAVGLDTRTGKFYIIKAKATVMAAGPVSGKRGNVVDNCTGDGIAIAFRAGAELTNMEFITGGNITVWQRKGHASGISIIQGHGAYFVNALGERFMEKYDPLLKERALLYQVCMGFAKEVLQGRGPIYVDMRHLSQDTFAKFRRVLPRTIMFWEKLGVDVSKETVECTPYGGVSSASGQGGIKVNLDCQTSVFGLYAAGAVTRIPMQGVCSMGGVPAASCNVMGHIAGEKAGQRAQLVQHGSIDTNQVASLKATAYNFSRRKEGPQPGALFEKLSKITIPAAFSMFKSEKRILKVLSEIEKTKEHLTLIAAPDMHELVRANEFRNFLQCVDLVFRAALDRQESRGPHYREDYPYQDNDNWLKLIVIKREGSGITLRYDPIPIPKWSVKPELSWKISHPVQMFLGD